MFSEARQQAKRYLKIIGGFGLLVLGVIMLVAPGPGWLTIALGLAMLATEFVWARRLLDRLKAAGAKLRNAVLPSSTSKPV